MFNDWGPYDYRDWNLTYPLQFYGDLSFMRPALIGNPQTLRDDQYRTLDVFSDGWLDKLNPGHSGSGEVTTYVQATM